MRSELDALLDVAGSGWPRNQADGAWHRRARRRRKRGLEIGAHRVFGHHGDSVIWQEMVGGRVIPRTAGTTATASSRSATPKAVSNSGSASQPSFASAGDTLIRAARLRCVRYWATACGTTSSGTRSTVAPAASRRRQNTPTSPARAGEAADRCGDSCDPSPRRSRRRPRIRSRAALMIGGSSC